MAFGGGRPWFEVEYPRLAANKQKLQIKISTNINECAYKLCGIEADRCRGTARILF